MKINRIDTAYYRLPPHRRILDAIQEVEFLDVIAARLYTENGEEGLGYTYTIGRGGKATKVLLDTEIVPLILGEDPLDIERLWEKMWWVLKKLMKKSAILEKICRWVPNDARNKFSA